jgi:hypothetical protein
MNTKEITNVVNSESKGFYVGNRLILPFRCQLLKLIVDGHIYTEFVGNEDIKISQESKNTSLYFREIGKLSHFEDTYKSIKMIVSGEDEDLTDQKTHLKLVCYIHDNNEVDLEVPGDDILFIS